MTAFWNIAPCSVVELGRRFRAAYCFHHQGDEYNLIRKNTLIKEAVLLNILTRYWAVNLIACLTFAIGRAMVRLLVACLSLGSRPGRSMWDCGSQGGTRTRFSPRSSVLPCQYHSTIALLVSGYFLRCGVIQSVPSTVTIFWCIVHLHLRSNTPDSSTSTLVAPETSSSKARRCREMSSNFADVASHSYYARFFYMP
jgi:hypothetical protein